MELSDLFQSGIFAWLQVGIALIVVLLFAVKFFELFFKRNLSEKRLGSGIHTILFLGSFGAIFGILIQILGIVQALTAIIEAADISPQIVMEGVKISFYNPIFGIVTFLISGIFWFILQTRYKNLLS